MIIIRPPIKKISKLLGDQAKKNGTEYRLTKHLLTVSCVDGLLLFHTLTKALILLKDDENINDYEEDLIKYSFYVPLDFEEEKVADNVTRLAKKLHDWNDLTTSFTIFTTTECNARCYYCYEMGSSRISMPDKVAYDVAEYIAKRCDRKKVSLRWFGGEPLCNKRAIEIITQSLFKKGIPYESQMISNGYYLDTETCKEAKGKWNLKKVQITLDGPKTVYQAIKSYANNDPEAYERVINNIENAIKNKIHVNVRLNMDKLNAKDLLKLVQELNNRFGSNDFFRVYVALLKPLTSQIEDFEDELEELDSYEKLLDMIDLYELGEIVPLSDGFNVNICMADNDSSEVILPDGRIGKCEHRIDKELIGSIYSNLYDEEMIESWKEELPKSKECVGCSIYPLCRQLKKCDYAESKCRLSEKRYRERLLSKQIIAEYNRYKNRGILTNEIKC